MRARVCASRKNMANVMEGAGFGDLIIERHGIKLNIPKEWLYSDGRMKKYAVELVDRMFAERLAVQEEMVG